MWGRGRAAGLGVRVGGKAEPAGQQRHMEAGASSSISCTRTHPWCAASVAGEATVCWESEAVLVLRHIGRRQGSRPGVAGCSGAVPAAISVSQLPAPSAACIRPCRGRCCPTPGLCSRAAPRMASSAVGGRRLMLAGRRAWSTAVCVVGGPARRHSRSRQGRKARVWLVGEESALPGPAPGHAPSTCNCMHTSTAAGGQGKRCCTHRRCAGTVPRLPLRPAAHARVMRRRAGWALAWPLRTCRGCRSLPRAARCPRWVWVPVSCYCCCSQSSCWALPAQGWG